MRILQKYRKIAHRKRFVLESNMNKIRSEGNQKNEITISPSQYMAYTIYICYIFHFFYGYASNGHIWIRLFLFCELQLLPFAFFSHPSRSVASVENFNICLSVPHCCCCRCFNIFVGTLRRDRKYMYTVCLVDALHRPSLFYHSSVGPYYEFESLHIYWAIKFRNFSSKAQYINK